jgi:hypothetical protein
MLVHEIRPLTFRYLLFKIRVSSIHLYIVTAVSASESQCWFCNTRTALGLSAKLYRKWSSESSGFSYIAAGLWLIALQLFSVRFDSLLHSIYVFAICHEDERTLKKRLRTGSRSWLTSITGSAIYHKTLGWHLQPVNRTVSGTLK